MIRDLRGHILEGLLQTRCIGRRRVDRERWSAALLSSAFKGRLNPLRVKHGARRRVSTGY